MFQMNFIGTIRLLSNVSVGNRCYLVHRIRHFTSLQDRHKEQSIKPSEFFIDPNIKKGFEKAKTDLFKQEELSFKGPPIQDLPTSDYGKLVYTGKLDKPFRAAKSLSLASSFGGAVCYPIMLPKILEEASLFVAIGYSLVSVTFILLTPSLIQMISKRYFTSIYYDEKSSIFTGVYKNFFMMERKIRFRSEDVEVPPITGMFTSMLIRKKPHFVNHEDFEDKEILKKMLGYDKEFDFSKYTSDVGKDDDDEPVDLRQKKKINK